MKIKITKQPELLTFEEFADSHGLDVEVIERDSSFHNTSARYYAMFSHGVYMQLKGGL